LKEKAGGDLVEVGVAHLVEDEKNRDSQHVEALTQTIHLDVVWELIEELWDSDEVDVVAVRHGLHSERDGAMCLADAGRSEQDDVLAVSEEAQRR